MFATFFLEKDPERWQDLLRMSVAWMHASGGLAFGGIVLYCLFQWMHKGTSSTGPIFSPFVRRVFRVAVLGMILGYGGYLALQVPALVNWTSSSLEGEGAAATPTVPGAVDTYAPYLLFLGSCSAVIAVLFPFLVDLARLRWRRIWAMASLSFKEAVRRRILWVFSSFLVIFLFTSWFIDTKPDSQLRTYVHVIYYAMTPLLLVTAGLLAAFSIPADIRSSTIHTIVTKPVERFEIVIGRFIGYVLLMSLVLVVMTGLSLLYMSREIDPEAKAESMRARVPIYGELTFFDPRDPNSQGQNVGREWEYRSYIPGGRNSQHRAIWTFRELPANLSDPSRGPNIPCEFTFDIFRTLKGEEGKGVFCSFEFLTNRWDPKLKSEYQAELEAERKKPDASADQIAGSMAEKYGIYEIPSKVVVDYITQGITIPSGLFRSITPQQTGERNLPPLRVVVKCESGGQYLGMAKRDFYILGAERSFVLNFIKGAIGLWLRICLVIGVSVASSTYLSGIIAGLTTMFLYLAGFFQEYVSSLAEGKVVGGGPMESVVRMLGREALVTPLDATPATQLAKGTDVAYRWVLRYFMEIIPNIERFNWTDYVAEGFNISMTNMVLFNGVMLLGYLLPWAILAYYLMRMREIATY
jgi:hypothetical protein